MIKRWKDYSKEQLLKRAKRLGIAGCESMTKNQLIWHLSRRCKKRKSKKAVSCRRKKISKRRKSRKSKRRVSKRRSKKVSLAKKTVKQLKRMAKSRGLKRYSSKKRAGLLRMLRAKKK